MFCPQCGTPNQEDASFCYKCGASFAEEASELQPEITLPSGKAYPTAFLLQAISQYKWLILAPLAFLAFPFLGLSLLAIGFGESSFTQAVSHTVQSVWTHVYSEGWFFRYLLAGMFAAEMGYAGAVLISKQKGSNGAKRVAYWIGGVVLILVCIAGQVFFLLLVFFALFAQ